MGRHRDAMEQAMVVRGFSAVTRETYAYWMRRLVNTARRTADKIDLRDVLTFQQALARSAARPATINQFVAAVRLFYRVVLRPRWSVRDVPYFKRTQSLP